MGSVDLRVLNFRIWTQPQNYFLTAKFSRSTVIVICVHRSIVEGSGVGRLGVSCILHM